MIDIADIKAWVDTNFPDYDMFHRTHAVTTINHYQDNRHMLHTVSQGNSQGYNIIIQAWLGAHPV